MKGRILFVLLASFGLASCATLSEYYTGQYQDGIYYRATPQTRLYSEADFAAMAARNIAKASADSLKLQPKNYNSGSNDAAVAAFLIAPLAINTVAWLIDPWDVRFPFWGYPFGWRSSWYWGPWNAPLFYDPFYDPWYWGGPYWRWGGWYHPWHHPWGPGHPGFYGPGGMRHYGTYAPRTQTYGRGVRYATPSNPGSHGSVYRGGSATGGHGMGYSPSRSTSSGSSINRSGSSSTRSYNQSYRSSDNSYNGGSSYRSGGSSTRSSSYSSPRSSSSSFSRGSSFSGGGFSGGHSGGGFGGGSSSGRGGGGGGRR